MTERVTDLGASLRDGKHHTNEGELVQVVADLALEEICQDTLGGAMRVPVSSTPRNRRTRPSSMLSFNITKFVISCKDAQPVQ